MSFPPPGSRSGDAAPPSVRAAVVAVLVVGLALTAVGVGLLVLAWHLPRSPFAFPGSSGLVGLSMLATGAVLALRRPANPIGWLFLAGGLIEAVLFVAAQYATGVLVGGWPLPAAWPIAWLQTWLWLPAIACFTIFTFLYFPEGRLPSTRWRWVPWLAVAGIATACVGLACAPGRIVNLGSVDNPLGSSAAWVGPALAIGFGIVFLALTLSIGALVQRRRLGSRVERLQIKWLAYAALLVGLLFLPAVVSSGVPVLPPAITVGLGDLLIVAVLLEPVAVMVAILRYRLYDIDRIVSRTVSYAVVTGVLVAVYLGSVALLSSVLPIGGSIGTAASVLLAAALFTPLRRRVQQVVDRRFDRARYDAEATVAAFAAQLQVAVELDAVRGDLLRIVGQTMHPASTTLWLRQP